MKGKYFDGKNVFRDIAIAVCKFEEGFRPSAYLCSEGYPTIGYGQKVGHKGESLSKYAGLHETVESASSFVEARVDIIIDNLEGFSWFDSLNSARKAMIVSMCYQMGTVGVIKFKNMIYSLNKGNYKAAKMHALDSTWARQTPNRANRQADVLESGLIETSYRGI